MPFIPRYRWLEIFVWAWCVLATVVILLALNFYHHHPVDFRRGGGPCGAPKTPSIFVQGLSTLDAGVVPSSP